MVIIIIIMLLLEVLFINEEQRKTFHNRITVDKNEISGDFLLGFRTIICSFFDSLPKQSECGLGTKSKVKWQRRRSKSGHKHGHGVNNYTGTVPFLVVFNVNVMDDDRCRDQTS